MAEKTVWDIDQLRSWACERILESLMYGRFREGVHLAVDQAFVAGRRAAEAEMQKKKRKTRR